MFKLLNNKSISCFNTLNKYLLNKNKFKINLFRNNLSESQTKSSKIIPNVISDEDRPQFPGSRSQWTQELKFVEPNSYDGIPVYRVINRNGRVVCNDSQLMQPFLNKEFVIKLFRGFDHLINKYIIR
jgi:2-oxoisovalerate dehydrogenase E1 component alpha subunit